MYAFLDTLETVSIRLSSNGHIALFLRGINDDRVINLIDGCKFTAFNDLVKSLESHHRLKTSDGSYNPIKVLNKQFECHKNNLYYFYEKITNSPDNYSLSVLEFYIERFSIEMFHFVKTMPTEKMNILKEKLNQESLWDEKECSGLLSCKEFIVSYSLE